MIKVTVYLPANEKSNPSIPIQFYADSIGSTEDSFICWQSTDERTGEVRYYTYSAFHVVGFVEDQVDDE